MHWSPAEVGPERSPNIFPAALCHIFKRANALIEPAAASEQLISLAAGLVGSASLLVFSCGLKGSSQRMPSCSVTAERTPSGDGKQFPLWLELIKMKNNSQWIEAGLVLFRTKGSSRIENINCFWIFLDSWKPYCRLCAASWPEMKCYWAYPAHDSQRPLPLSFAAFVPRTQEHMVRLRATAFALKWSRGVAERGNDKSVVSWSREMTNW